MMLPLYNKSSENASVSEKIREQRIRFARAEGSRISQHSGGIGCTDLAVGINVRSGSQFIAQTGILPGTEQSRRDQDLSGIRGINAPAAVRIAKFSLRFFLHCHGEDRLDIVGIGENDARRPATGRCDKPRIRNARHLRIVRPVGQPCAVGFDLVLLSGMEISSSAVQSQKA